ncbi:hypothetical protein BJ742DRAFT_845810 [Cladochytrium replicatum]|nr:hypothetical protein BJ742DRAFT_845810 [Cladochytrium replicatum]
MGTQRPKRKPHIKTAKKESAALKSSVDFAAADVADRALVRIAADSSTIPGGSSSINSRETLPVLQESGLLPGAVTTTTRATSVVPSLSSGAVTNVVPPSTTTARSTTTTTTTTTTTSSAAILTSITTTSPQSSTTTTEKLTLVSLDVPTTTSFESPTESIAGFGPSFPTLPVPTTTSSVDAEQNGRGFLANSGQLAGFISIGVVAVAVVLAIAFFAVWSKKNPVVPAGSRSRPTSKSEKSLLRRSSPSEMTGTSSYERGYARVNYVANPTPPGLVWTDSIAFVPVTFPAYSTAPDSASTVAYAIPYPVQLAPAPISAPTTSWPLPPTSVNRTPNRSTHRAENPYDRMSVEVVPNVSSVETNSTSHLRNDSNQTSLTPLAEYANQAATRYPSIYTSAGRPPRTLGQNSRETPRSGESRHNRISVIRSEERLNQQSRSAVSSPRLSFYYQDDSPRATTVSTGNQESIPPRHRTEDIDEVSSYWSSMPRSTLDRRGQDSFGRSGNPRSSYWSSMPRGGRGSTATRSTEETDDSFDSRRRSSGPKDGW